MTAPLEQGLESERTPLVGRSVPKQQHYSSSKSIVWCLVGVAMGVSFMAAPFRHKEIPLKSSTSSPYSKVQGLGFGIYTGGAPAFLEDNATKNPECIGTYGNNAEGDVLQCYLGHDDALEDVEARLTIMRHAVERAHALADPSNATLKIFMAPEFYWRGVNGAYVFQDDSKKCGAICHILQGLEEIVAQERFQDWLFVFGTVVAFELLPKKDKYDYLFYNFAPVYKGYNPNTSYEGRRFLVPKRYVSSSDFLTPERNMDNDIKELVEEKDNTQDTTIVNPFDLDQKRYDYDMWRTYKEELNELGYTMIEYGWLILDEVSMTIEICFDHDQRTALNSYLADMVTGSTTRIPNSSNEGLTFTQIPRHQAQISLVSSAGMTVTPDALALTHNGTIFLQDGLSNEPPVMFMENRELQFEGGMEAVQRRAILTPTDVYFEHKVVETYTMYSIYNDNNWKEAVNGTFSMAVYEPKLTVYEPMDIAQVTASQQ